MRPDCKARTRAAAAAALVALGACASGGADTGGVIADPYEGFNRNVHAFNVAADTYVLRPVARGYDAVTPGVVQPMLANAVGHLRLPLVFVNNVLQADADAALATFGRFGVNTIVGAGGLLDPATEFGLPYAGTDFGLTLAGYGAEEGVFWMLPIFGPSTSRDVVGAVGDVALNPLTHVTLGGGSGETAATVAQYVVPPVVLRDANGAVIDQILYETEDSYVTLRTTYVQNRRNAVNGGVVDTDALPDIYGD